MELILMFAMPGLVTLLVYLLIFCIVIGAAYWFITNLLPAPFQKWAIAIVIVIAVIVLVSLLLPLAGGGGGPKL